ncbi:MAG: ImmA/IrrE family metallo-endopeptidase [Leptotrichiaceae bacterium]|nr:ImmA/IrrE family metallo-endopeptidase [Leptotrichiaceae bacterium]
MRKRKNIKQRVKNLIEKYNTKNPYELCRKLNIHIKYMDLGNIKGYFKKVLGNKYIVINENLDDYSKKVVLSHELGHGVMHSSKDVLLMKENFYRYTPELENEANEFAAELLSYDEQEVSYDLIENCDLGLEVMEEIRKYKKF